MPVLISSRVIAVGEQLTFDYADGQYDNNTNDNDDTNDDIHNNNKRMRTYKYCLSRKECHCNTSKCRGYLPSYC